MKILIIRFSSIGDIVLTTPVIRCLKQQLNAEIHFITKKQFSSLLSDNPSIDKLLFLEDNLMQTIKTLKAENYDYIIDLHHNLRTFFIKLFLQKKTYSFKKLNIEKWLYVNFKINKLPKKHIVDRYLATCQKLGITNDNKGLDFFIHPSNELKIEEQLQIKTPYLVWVIGAKQNTKQFPIHKIITTLNSPDFPNIPIVLVGGKEDIANSNIIIENCGSKNIVNTCGKYNLQQSASILKQAKLVVTNDTGMMHIAAAFQKPIISIWGNTVPAFGMYPYISTNSIITEINNLACRPCSKLGYQTCPKKHFNCMNLHKESELIQHIQPFFN